MAGDPLIKEGTGVYKEQYETSEVVKSGAPGGGAIRDD